MGRVAADLATDPVAGLAAAEAASRLARFGENVLVEQGRTPARRLLAGEFAPLQSPAAGCRRGSGAVQLAILYLPVLQALFGTQALGPVELVVVLVASPRPSSRWSWRS